MDGYVLPRRIDAVGCSPGVKTPPRRAVSQIEVLEKCLSPPLPPDGKAEASPWGHTPYACVAVVSCPLKSNALGHTSSGDRRMLRGTLAWDDRSPAAC